MSRCCRNWSAPWDRNGTLLVQQQLSCDWLDGVSGSGPIRGGRWGEKKEKHHRSHECSRDKVGDFCKRSRCSELDGSEMSPPLSEYGEM